MAELQGFFLFCRDDVKQAISMAESWRAADEEVVQELQLRRQSESISNDSDVKDGKNN